MKDVSQGGSLGGYARPIAYSMLGRSSGAGGGFKGLPGPGLSQPGSGYGSGRVGIEPWPQPGPVYGGRDYSQGGGIGFSRPGPLPGYASGGLATGPAVVGENGPEVINPTPYGTVVMPSGDYRNALVSQITGTPGGGPSGGVPPIGPLPPISSGGPGTTPPGGVPPPSPGGLQYGGRDQYGNLINPPQWDYNPIPGQQMKKTFIGPFQRMPSTQTTDMYGNPRMTPYSGQGTMFSGWSSQGQRMGANPAFGGGQNSAWEVAAAMGWITPERALQEMGYANKDEWFADKQGRADRIAAADQPRLDAMAAAQQAWEQRMIAQGEDLFDESGSYRTVDLYNSPEWRAMQAQLDVDPFANQMMQFNRGYVDANGNWVNDPNGWAAGWLPNDYAGWAGESGPFYSGQGRSMRGF